MKALLLLLGLSLSISSYGQTTKVTLGNTPINNLALPQDFTDRVFWNQTDLFKYNLDQLTGSIVYTEKDGENFLRGPRIVDAKSAPQLKTIQNGLVYHSKVDKGFSADLKLFIFSSGITDDQVVDLKITDLTSVFIDYEKIPIEPILTATKNIKGTGRKYYIQGVLLTSVDQQYNSKVTKNGAITGAAFSANGKVYSESEKTVHDFRIALTLIDIDKLTFFKGSSSLSNANDLKQLILSSMVKKSMSIKLTGFE